MNRVNSILHNAKFINCLNEIVQLEQQRIFCNHQIDHLLGVARIMYINSLENHLNINKEKIYATALLHDIGRGIAYKNGTNHAEESAVIAKEILMECGFEKEAKEILLAILHHNDDVNGSDLSALLKQADKLSRNCYFCSAYNECNWKTEKKNKGVTL